MRTGPEEYTEGLGEVIRGYRLYLGLGRLAMADELGMAIRSYERIEDGHRACPPGLMDTLEKTRQRFDDDVAEIQSLTTDPEVHTDVASEWHRAVAGRAAMIDDRITPRLKRYTKRVG